MLQIALSSRSIFLRNSKAFVITNPLLELGIKNKRREKYEPLYSHDVNEYYNLSMPCNTDTKPLFNAKFLEEV